MAGKSSKTNLGNFFEDFSLGQRINHATPRTLTDGERSFYFALYGPRFALQSSDQLAHSAGFPVAPLDDLLVFHTIFGKTVPDISLNAVANLGYAECRFLTPVLPGDTVSATSEVIGLKETSKGDAGIVYVRTEGKNQRGDSVLSYVRWVMVRKRDPQSPAPAPHVPELAAHVTVDRLATPHGTHFRPLNLHYTGSQHLWEDYEVGEKIDHADGQTVEEAEHQLITRLYQNTARVHFNQHTEGKGRFGRRLIYGGHVMSIARALSFNGLENAFFVAAINGGRHVAPLFAGETVYAWSEVLEKSALPLRHDLGALRLRTIAVKDMSCADFPGADTEGAILDLDYWVLIPRR